MQTWALILCPSMYILVQTCNCRHTYELMQYTPAIHNLIESWSLINILCLLTFQVIKRITDGGADYSFECIGDTGMITTALQSCCDVRSIK